MASTQTDRNDPGTAPDIVDVIVPVYRGKDETARCLESLLENQQRLACEVIVVDDASPDAELTAYIDELAAAGRITLLSNEANIGYVDSANLGMMLHPDRDVVLLNSDTEVHGGWLDRLHACIQANPKTGTATPFSNNATICSYPRFLEDNALPDDCSLAQLDDIFHEVNRGMAVQIPTAIGFCVYITRECINAAGYLDSLHFGRGYGEENDFCMRASAAGFRHMLCGDAFVFHSGGVSFGDGAGSKSEAAQEILRRRHPQYEPAIHAHFAADPQRELRRRVDIARLARSRRQRLLMVTHRLGGGTEKAVRDLARLLEPDYEVLIMRPSDYDTVSIAWARTGEEFSAFFKLPESYDEMTEFLKGLGIARIHLHHLVELPDQVLGLAGDLEVPYDYSSHDYFVICPLYNLIGTDGRYCGEGGEENCKICLSGHEALAGLDIGQWRSRWRDMLGGAERVIVPSLDAAHRLEHYFPEARYVTLPHPEEPEMFGRSASEAGKETKVLILGELSLSKGIRLLEACAVDASKRGLPICFRVLGWARENVRQEPDVPLFFLGPYEDAQLARLIEQERADVIFFPAQWPETYSYTLSAALKSGLPIAAPHLGAFTERLESYPGAMLMDWQTSPADWNDLFLSLCREEQPSVHES